MKRGANGWWRWLRLSILTTIMLLVSLDGCSRSFLSSEPRRLSLLYTGSRSGWVEPSG